MTSMTQSNPAASDGQLPEYAHIRADDELQDQRQARRRLFEQYECSTRSSESQTVSAERRAEARRDYYRQYEVGFLRREVSPAA